jgi:hypothetical protein
MTEDEVCERLERAAFGTTRRAALTTLLGGALLLGEAEVGEATRKAERRKKRKKHQRNEPWQTRLIEVTLDNTLGMNAATVQYGMYNGSLMPERCCRLLTTTTIPAHGKMTFQAPRPDDFFRTVNAFFWIGNKYWFTFLNPRVGKPKIGIAINGMLDHDAVDVCCPRMPWGQTVEYERGLGENQRYSWDIEGRAWFIARRLTNTYTHQRFVLQLPEPLPTGTTPIETPA